MSRPKVPSLPPEWEVIWMIGLALGGIAYGSLITIGIQCLMTFNSSASKTSGKREGKRTNLHLVLQIHVILILVLNTLLKIWQIRRTVEEVVFTDPMHFTLFERDWARICIFLIIALTDGHLVWRCYMVQRALFKNRPAGFHNLCWILPLVVYLSSFPVGVATFSAFLDPHIPSKTGDPSAIFNQNMAFFLAAAALNIFINTFVTCNIIIRLLLYRRTIISAFGKSCALAEYPLHISCILLESAAINIPLTMVMLLGTALGGNYVSVVMDIAVPGQSIASILVTCQVVRGRAISPDSKVPGLPEALEAGGSRNV